MRGQRSPFFGVYIIHCAFACDVIQLIAFQPGAGHTADLLQLQGKPQAGKVIVVGSCGQMDRHRALVAQIGRGGGFAHLDAQQPVFSSQQVNHLRVAAQVQKGELIVLQAHRLQIGQSAHIDLCHGGITHPQVDHCLVLPQLQAGQRPAQIGEMLQILIGAQVQLLNGIVAAGQIAQRRISAHIQAGQPVCVAVQNSQLRRTGGFQLTQAVVVAEQRLQLGHHCQVQRGERVVVAVQIFQVRELLQPLQGCNPPVAYVHTDHLLPLRGRKAAAGICIQTAHVR